MFGGSRPAAGGAGRALERPRERAAAGSVAQSPIDWQAIAGDVARALLGEPSSATRTELRYGRKGSLSVRLDSGTWFDFEAGTGGGVLALVERERASRAAALAWLEAEGFIGQRDPALTRPESRCRPRAVETSNPTAPKLCAAQPASRAGSRRFARRIWKTTRPLAGTFAECYLAARGISHVAGVPALRYHPALSHSNAPGRFPCLVVGVQDAGGRFLGIQRTYPDFRNSHVILSNFGAVTHANVCFRYTRVLYLLVVPTLPVDFSRKPCILWLHVLASEETNQGRKGAPVLEHRRELSQSRRACRATPSALSRRNQR